MPYASNDELPAAVKSAYTDRCQTVFRKAFNAADGDEASQFAQAHTAAKNCMDATAGKAAPLELKATLVDDNHFRLLAIPFGGPVRGRDLDGDYFTRRTDIKADWFESRPVLWHHGMDPTGLMGTTVLGKAVLDDEPTDEGWWVDVWLNAGERRTQLVKALAAKAPLYGSSQALPSLVKRKADGEITVWPYVEQTLTTSPQNTLSVVRSAKALLDDFDDAEIAVHGALKAFLADLDDLGADLSPTWLQTGDVEAKAGRVLSAANEAALRAALEQLDRVLAQLQRSDNQAQPNEEGTT